MNDLVSDLINDIIGDETSEQLKDEKLTDVLSNALQSLCDKLPDLYGKKTVSENEDNCDKTKSVGIITCDNKHKKDEQTTTTNVEKCQYGGDCYKDCMFYSVCNEPIADTQKYTLNSENTSNTLDDKFKDLEKALDKHENCVKYNTNKEDIETVNATTNNDYSNIGNIIKSITSDPIRYTTAYIQYKLKQLFDGFINDTLTQGYKMYPNKEYSIRASKQIWTIEIPMDYCVHECIYDFDEDEFNMQMEKIFYQYGFHMLNWTSNYYNIKFFIEIQ
jgi:hypothetical protein